jgi:hypothetical protein
MIRIVGLATGEPTPFDGRYVAEYDPGQDGIAPDGRRMKCLLRTTANPAEALRAPQRELFELWRAVDPRKPLRWDGKPNRPLTAFTVTFEAAS